MIEQDNSNSTEKKAEISEKNQYTSGYRKVIDHAFNLASETVSGVLTVAVLLRALLECYPDIFSTLLGKKCIIPEYPSQDEKGDPEKHVCFSSEVDRYLSVFGGVMSDILSNFHHPVEIDEVFIAAALLWEPSSEAEDILNTNGIAIERRKQVLNYILARENKNEKQTIKKRQQEIKRILKTVSSGLEKVCLGQKAAIRTITLQLSTFLNSTEQERQNKPLSFYFCGSSGTGKSFMAKHLYRLLSKALNIEEIDVLSMERYTSQQEANDLIGRDSSWKDGGRQGVLTSRACQNPKGVIIIDNYDLGHPDAVAHIEAAIDQGQLIDHYTRQKVSFANNIIILTSNKGADALESGTFMHLCQGTQSQQIPRDKIIEGLCSSINQTNKTVGGIIRTILLKVDAPVLFKKLDTSTVVQIIRRDADTIINKLKQSFHISVECNVDALVAFCIDTLEKTDSAHEISSMVKSVLYYPVQELMMDLPVKTAERKLIVNIDTLPDLECDFSDSTPNSLEWVEARTSKRRSQAKRLDYRVKTSVDGSMINLNITNLHYIVLPSIEDVGFFSVKAPNVSFNELVGLEIPWQSVQRTISYFRNPDDKIKPETGILLIGPPGTGKTSFAKAVANKLETTFISVTGSDLVIHGPEGIEQLFDTASKYNSILFIDELDAVGSRNSGNSSDLVINKLLSELDGYKDRKILVIGATNRIDKLDEALLRAGRFNDIIKVGLLQKAEDRQKLIDITCRKADIPIEDSVKDFIVKTTFGCSPAVLVSLIRETLHNSLEAGHAVCREDFILARKNQYLGKETQNTKLEGSIRKKVALHESGHALAAYLHKHRFIQVTLNAGSGALGFLEEFPSEIECCSDTELLSKIDIVLAGHAAQKICGVLGEGAYNDFKQATSYAFRYFQAGFGKNASYVVFPGNEESELERKKIIPLAETLLQERMSKTIDLLTNNQNFLMKIANELELRGILFEDDFIRLENELNQHCNIVN